MEELAKYSSFTEEEKELTMKICQVLMSLSEKARREGILALEEMLDDIDAETLGKPFLLLKKLMSLVVDGTDENVIRRVADTYIASSCDNDVERLHFMMVRDGTLGIQEGNNPRILGICLISYAGLENTDELSSILNLEY